jgi:hypothetical protein
MIQNKPEKQRRPKKSSSGQWGDPRRLPLFQPIRFSGYSTKETMPGILQKFF